MLVMEPSQPTQGDDILTDNAIELIVQMRSRLARVRADRPVVEKAGDLRILNHLRKLEHASEQATFALTEAGADCWQRERLRGVAQLLEGQILRLRKLL